MPPPRYSASNIAILLYCYIESYIALIMRHFANAADTALERLYEMMIRRAGREEEHDARCCPSPLRMSQAITQECNVCIRSRTRFISASLLADTDTNFVATLATLELRR